MIKVRTKVKVDDLQAAVDKRAKKGQVILDEQVLKDSNLYAPQDTSELIRSSLRTSQVGEGMLIWDTPYARRLYYNPNYEFSTDKNPRAGGLWFEIAKANHLEEWKLIVAKAMGGKV